MRAGRAEVRLAVRSTFYERAIGVRQFDRLTLPPGFTTAAAPEASGVPYGDESPEPRTDRRIGQLVDGKYFILRRLACGGMGSVYEARHTVVGTHFALKFLHDQYAQKSTMVQRFLREAQAAGSIASEHIIGVLDYGTSEGTPYLVMELVRGQDLRELLGVNPRLEERRAVRIVLDACRGLALAHDRGLVHRDLKPANICITSRSDGREVAKVIDFGVAKLRDGADLSEEGTLIGTVGYMAPEQLTDHRQLDARADIYALGVILYQCLAGRPPHLCGRSELLFRIVSVDPRPLAELCPELSPGLSEVVMCALARHKERRYPGARELAQALEPYAEDAARVPAPLPERRSAPRRRLGPDLGNAPTELESSPTWAALTAPERADPRADRQCERESSPDAAESEAAEFCRQPRGFVTAAPAPTREQHLTHRALSLSVGALVLSVVAMTTMFVFVYSHGESALEVRAAPRTSAQLASAPSTPTPEPSGRTPAAARQCVEKGSPLAPASVLESATGGSGPAMVVRALREAQTEAVPSTRAGTQRGSDENLELAQPCE